jgi:low temperature requirement protein LtrA
VNGEGLDASPEQQQHSAHHSAQKHAEHLRFGHVDFEALQHHAAERQHRYLIRRPRALQYFHRSKLFRSAEERTSGRLELFFDLVYVGIISVLAEEAVSHPDGASLVVYLITYLPAWLIWLNMCSLLNSMYNDDIFQRTLVFWVMALLIVYGNNAPHVATGEIDPRRTTIVTYLVVQLSLLSTLFLYSFYVKEYGVQFRANTLAYVVPIGLYIGALFTSTRVAIGLVFAGLALEYFSWNFIYHPIFKRVFRLEYSSAVNIEHEVDRHADFFSIVMGEFLYTVISGSPAGVGIHRAAGRAVLCLLVAACLQLFYMIGGGSIETVHPLRRSANTAFGWFALHIPLVASLTLAGEACGELVREEEVQQGVRWMFCGGICVGLVCLAVLALLEHEKDERGTLYMRKVKEKIPRC